VLLNNYVEMRADLHKILRLSERPVVTNEFKQKNNILIMMIIIMMIIIKTIVVIVIIIIILVLNMNIKNEY